MIEQIMVFSSGFLVASLVTIMLIPLIHNRAVRLTTRQLEESLPMALSDVQANMDCVRAEFAVATRRLESRIEQLQATAATQLGEIGRKAEAIRRLKAELARKAVDHREDLGRDGERPSGRIEHAKREPEEDEAISTTPARLARNIDRLPSTLERLLTKFGIERLQQRAPETAHRKTLEPERHSGPLADLERSLLKRGQLLSRCDAQVDALFDEIAVIDKEPAAPKVQPERSVSTDGRKSRKATRSRG
jgi:hypothetical protein